MRRILIFICVLFSGMVMFISCKKEKDNATTGIGNQRPIANAGADQLITLPIDSVELNGTGTKYLPGTSYFELTFCNVNGFIIGIIKQIVPGKSAPEFCIGNRCDIDCIF